MPHKPSYLVLLRFGAISKVVDYAMPEAVKHLFRISGNVLAVEGLEPLTGVMSISSPMRL